MMHGSSSEYSEFRTLKANSGLLSTSLKIKPKHL